VPLLHPGRRGLSRGERIGARLALATLYGATIVTLAELIAWGMK
jgi:hypothetical protein